MHLTITFTFGEKAVQLINHKAKRRWIKSRVSRVGVVKFFFFYLNLCKLVVCAGKACHFIFSGAKVLEVRSHGQQSSIFGIVILTVKNVWDAWWEWPCYFCEPIMSHDPQLEKRCILYITQPLSSDSNFSWKNITNIYFSWNPNYLAHLLKSFTWFFNSIIICSRSTEATLAFTAALL